MSELSEEVLPSPTKGFKIYGITFFLWTITGLLWYKWFVGWTNSTSYLYTIITGFSIGYPDPEEPMNPYCHFFTIVLVLSGSILISSAAGFCVSYLVTPVNAVHAKTYKMVGKSSSLMGFRYYLGWCSSQMRIRIFSLLLIWIVIGTHFAYTAMNFSFMTSLYWSITTLSTGGLKSMPCTNPTYLSVHLVGNACEVDSYVAIFGTSWTLLGVPIYAVALGQIATMWIEYCAEEVELRKLRTPLSMGEFKAGGKILREASEEHLDPIDFILLQLLRLGQVDSMLIDELNKAFSQIDQNSSGYVTEDDLVAAKYYVKNKNGNTTFTTPASSPRSRSVSPSKRSTPNSVVRPVQIELKTLSSGGTSVSGGGGSPSPSEMVVDAVPIASPGEDKLEEDGLDEYISGRKPDGHFERKRVHVVIKRILSNPLSVIFIVYGAWLFIGTVFYANWNNWQFYTAFYYCVNAGLSIGYGDVLEPIEPVTQVFTIFYVLFGSSVINGSSTYFISHLLQHKSTSGMQEATHAVEDWGRLFLHQSFRFKTSLLLLFILFTGTIYGIIKNQWHVVTSLYFSITALSGAGCLGSPCITGYNETCDLGPFASIFVGIFSLIGYPLYQVTMGQFSIMAWEKNSEELKRKRLLVPISKDEFDFASSSVLRKGSITRVLKRGNFVLLQIMRLGRTNRVQLARINGVFHDIDEEERGTIHFSDIQKMGIYLDDQLEDLEEVPSPLSPTHRKLDYRSKAKSQGGQTGNPLSF